jgi:predicted HAD superfamily hydrolase
MVKICSFDVFETCLIRKVAAPSDVFYEVAKKVFAKLGIPLNRPVIEDFVVARIRAEQVARQESGREDTSLDEIWQKLVQAMGWQYDESLVQSELDAEEELLAPIFSIRKQVQAARQQGCRIIFVSDMYLPREFIRRQLVKYSFAQTGDGLYVSGDVGKTKASGNLFRHLLVQENVPAKSVWHTGDNQHSDHAVPRKLGIHARLFTEAKLTRAEISIMQTSQDFGAVTRIAGAMRAFRLGCESEEKKNINELVSQFVAPFVMGFATWVLQRAQEDGVKRLYFLSRDCQLVWKVAKELSPQFGGIDCRYLYVSRQALSLSSATAISPEGMPWLRRAFEEPILKKLLAKIELKFEDVQPVLGQLAGNKGALFRIESEEDWQQFWHALNKEPAKTQINKLMDERREAARRYFESVGLFESERWSLVDFGWILTCQQSLKKLFRKWGWNDDVKGFYFGLRNDRITPASSGKSEALFYQPAFDFPQGSNLDNIFRNVLLLEHIVGCADHPTVHHYGELDGGKTGPVFASSVNEPTLKLCEQLHKAVLDFVAQNQVLTDDFKDETIGREVLSSLATDFFKFPSKPSANALHGLSIAIDQNGFDAQPVMRPLNIGDALLPLLPRRRPFMALWKSRNFFWPEASMVSSPKAIQRISTIVQLFANLRAKIRRIITN